jgi:hypothetical protein
VRIVGSADFQTLLERNRLPRPLEEAWPRRSETFTATVSTGDARACG